MTSIASSGSVASTEGQFWIGGQPTVTGSPGNAMAATNEPAAKLLGHPTKPAARSRHVAARRRENLPSYVLRYELPDPIAATDVIVPLQPGLALNRPLSNEGALDKTSTAAKGGFGSPSFSASSFGANDSAIAAIQATAPLAVISRAPIETTQLVIAEPGLATPGKRLATAQTSPVGNSGGQLALVDSAQELDGFDLAQLARPIPPRLTGSSEPGSPDQASAEARNKLLQPSAPAASPGLRDKLTGDYIAHQTKVAFNGYEDGNISVRVGMNGTLAIKLADLLRLVQPSMVPTEFQRLASSSAANEFVSFATIRAAGVGIRYDAARDTLKLSTDD